MMYEQPQNPTGQCSIEQENFGRSCKTLCECDVFFVIVYNFYKERSSHFTTIFLEDSNLIGSVNCSIQCSTPEPLCWSIHTALACPLPSPQSA